MIGENLDILTMEELNKVLVHAKNRKSPGLDNLPVELIRCWENKLKVQLLELFNNIVDNNQIAQEWKTGLVINIYKKGSESKCKKYRGITLFSTAYKLFPNIIIKKLNYSLEEEM